MTLRETLFQLQDSPLAHAVSKSHHLVGAALQVVHIAGFVALLAAAVLLTLRSSGWVLRSVPRERLQREMARFLWTGLALTIGSGVVMFVSAPLLYYDNRAFELKMLLVLVAFAAQLALFRRSGSAPRIATAASLCLWVGVGIAGRAIGFV